MAAACQTEASRQKTPTLELSGETQLPESTNCLTCSDDGRYLSLGHSRGLSVWCASSLICAAEWLQDTLEITSVQMTRMAETAYLLGTVDDMGVARVFAYHCQSIYLLNVINIMEDVNKRSICLAFELSEGGEYGAASISCNSAACLEVYHFPSEAWLKELETARSHQQDQDSSEDVGVEWSPVALVCKIKPPKVPAGTVLDGSLEALQITDFFTHCLALDVETSSSCQQKKQSFDTDAGKTKETNESPRRCTQHFLLPCGRFPGDTIAKSQPAGLPVAVCVWWSGSHNLLQYFLQKAPKNKQDVDPMPDVLWPNSKEILCSAVSTCTRYIALGLNNALVCVWDRLSGSPLSVVCVTAATDSAFFRMQFVDSWPRTADDIQTFTPAKVHLLVLCKSGAIHTVTTGRGAQACTEQLTGRPKDSGDLPTVTAPVPFLQSLSLVVQRNGKVLLQDVINKTTVCFLIPPTTHVIATPCNPVYALNSRQQTLFIQGDLDPSCSASSTDGSQSKLFIFRFGEPGIIKQYILPLPDSPREQNTLSCVTLEESCNLYLQQRQVTWKQLQETAVTQQRGHSRAAAN
ncbi:WD repeat-containing protein 93 isoform X1 [Epinephelus moara]|uniref:WD repeat-containing protein 93 isoform X1 n=2 Tax=Epinephelus moara TaxID=300413 RepID=UPI00214E0CC8|nr:WD repeat-containing protein 93 isoform X1 [Epinephelus moara]XP_049904841.1 WD repeat-containing protein 93 isoform X1 [Epinephelus moara]XP_049904849.1 WD repeat-containing protein 93 isoform X1 [Epinephelus moara]